MTRSRRSSPTSGPCPRRRRPRRHGRAAGPAAVLLAVATVCAIPTGSTRSLGSIEARGVISLCAHPNALPFASRKDDPQGFQIDLARAIAGQLGVDLDIAWVVSPIQYRSAECDIIMDTIVDEQLQAEGRVRVSKPYHHSGVALALPKGADGGSSFRDLDRKRRIGVQVGSLAQMVLGKRGQQTTPFGFEDEMLEALGSGTIDGAAASPAAIAYFNLRHPGQSLRLVHAYEQEPELSWNVAVGMRGSDASLRQRIDGVIERMLADGSIRDIYARYGVEHRPPSNSR
jgi:polar amino acid transport system substrate-binding protein